MNLLDLLRVDGHNLNRAAATGGGEYSGGCPFCGGTDRFRVWPGKDRFWCRACGKAGDSIQYLRDFRGLSFIEACGYLGSKPARRQVRGGRATADVWSPKKITAPPKAWQVKAQVFLDRAIDTLWTPAGETARTWLNTEKGLNNTTIKAANLGLNACDLYAPRAAWGLEPSYKENGKERRQWAPAGLVIPLTIAGAVQRLRIRRADPGDGQRYILVSGSSAVPMTWGQDQAAAVIVESEIDGLLVYQEAGDICAVVAMGNAQAKPDAMTHEILKWSKKILCALDSDQAGAGNAWTFWAKTYSGKFTRWPVPFGKDPSDAWLEGLDVRAWVEAGISE